MATNVFVRQKRLAKSRFVNEETLIRFPLKAGCLWRVFISTDHKTVKFELADDPDMFPEIDEVKTPEVVDTSQRG